MSYATDKKYGVLPYQNIGLNLEGRVNCCGIAELWPIEDITYEPDDDVVLFNVLHLVLERYEQSHVIFSEAEHASSRAEYREEDDEEIAEALEFALPERELVFDGYGERLAKLITNRGLGYVADTSGVEVKNPNSGNFVRVYVWAIDYPACKKEIKRLADKFKVKYIVQHWW